MVDTVFFAITLTLISFFVVYLYNRRINIKVGLKEDKTIRYRFLITMLFFVFFFGMIIIFYLKGGLDDVKTIWSFLGPLMGFVIGWWFPQQR